MYRHTSLIKQASLLSVLTASCILFASTVNADTSIPAPTAGETSSSTLSTTTSTGTSGDASSSGSGGVLQQIATATQGTLQKVNNLPDYLDALLKLAVSWLTPDTTSTTAGLQTLFATYGSQMQHGDSGSLTLQQTLVPLIFGKNLTTLSASGQINDLTYTSLLGSPYLTPDPRNNSGSGPAVNAALNYIENASGSNIIHVIPDPTWPNGAAYSSYYSAVTAVQSYDAYILGKVYAEKTATSPMSKTRASLVTQASSSQWFSQIASEELGVVLRQILMYNSQTYVLLAQLVDTQKELLTAQVMNNTLVVLVNQLNESHMVSNANAPRH